MRKVIAWFKTIFQEAIAKALAVYIAGAITAVVALLLSPATARFLLQTVQVPLILVIILSIFSLISLAIAVDKIAFIIRAGRSVPRAPIARDEALEKATANLLAKLSRVEAGIEFYSEPKESIFVTELLSLFDTWEASIQSYLITDELAPLPTLRERISRQSLEHASAMATEWVRSVKETTNLARSRVGR